jgi:proteasome lid subunit RPN8/RPN11
MPGKKLQMLKISKSQLQESLDSLKLSTNKEKVLLWIGERIMDQSIVLEVFEPIQLATSNYFEIPKEGIQEIIDKVKKDKRIVLAQIHSHPDLAFHSRTDDKMAVPRHEGAYSLVLPKFASKTNVKNFHNQVAAYRLNNMNLWIKVANSNIEVYE